MGQQQTALSASETLVDPLLTFKQLEEFLANLGRLKQETTLNALLSALKQAMYNVM